MPLIVKDTSKDGAGFEPISSGMHHSVCYAVIDIGTQPQTGQYPSRRKVVICWETTDERIDIEKDGKKVSLPRAISAKYTLSLAQKGNLRPMLESWRGRPFSDQELEGFDIGALVGANCFLNVVHKNGVGEKAKNVYANVASVNPLPKGMAKVKPENPTILFSMDDFEGPVTIPAGIPEWIEGLIKQSDEYLAKAQTANAPAPAQQDAANGAPVDDVQF